MAVEAFLKVCVFVFVILCYDVPHDPLHHTHHLNYCSLIFPLSSLIFCTDEFNEMRQFAQTAALTLSGARSGKVSRQRRTQICDKMHPSSLALICFLLCFFLPQVKN